MGFAQWRIRVTRAPQIAGAESSACRWYGMLRCLSRPPVLTAEKCSAALPIMRAHGRWAFHLVPGDLVQTLPPRHVWDGDGIIARVETAALLRQLARRNLPTVVLNRRFASDKFPGVGGNQHISCRMIAEHFLTRGFRRLAYCGMANVDYCVSREQQFREFLNQNGIEPEVFWYAHEDKQSFREQVRLVEWLKRLAKPLGLFACDDLQAPGNRRLQRR